MPRRYKKRTYTTQQIYSSPPCKSKWLSTLPHCKLPGYRLLHDLQKCAESLCVECAYQSSSIMIIWARAPISLRRWTPEGNYRITFRMPRSTGPYVPHSWTWPIARKGLSELSYKHWRKPQTLSYLLPYLIADTRRTSAVDQEMLDLPNNSQPLSPNLAVRLFFRYTTRASKSQPRFEGGLRSARNGCTATQNGRCT